MIRDQSVIAGQIDLSSVQGLLFDVDGTLSDTDDHLGHRMANHIKPLAWLLYDQDPQHFARWLVMAVETPANFFYSAADRMGFDAPLAKFYSYLSRKRHEKTPSHERFWIVPGIKAMLDVLYGRYQLAIVSARDKQTTMHFLEHFDLTRYFEVIVTAQTCERTKPFPDPVLCAANQMGLQPEHCIMVGDTVVDVLAGKSAGAQTIAVLCGFGTQRELTRAGANLIVSSTADISPLLASKSQVVDA
jgi:phosphoglycolate phosphatase-like HAD superfamily hydrolase